MDKLPFKIGDVPIQRNFDALVKGLLTITNALAARVTALESLKRVRGVVGSGGTIVNGTGWTVSRTGVGAYTVTFDTAFADVPSVVITPQTGGSIGATTGTVTASSFTVRTFTTTTGAVGDVQFHFVAIGP